MTYPKQSAILINPKTRTISVVELTAGGSNDDEQLSQHMKEMYALIGCTNFDVACTVDDKHDLYIDDEGLYKPAQAFFAFESEHMGEMPFAGNGLIIGFDKATGSSAETTITMLEVAQKVRWLTDGGEY